MTIMEGTTKLGEVVVGESGSFSFTLPTAKLNGEIMSLTATDHAGNTSEPGTVEADDTTPPATPIITNVADDVPETLGTVVSGSLTDDRTPLISGTGEIGTKIYVYSEAIQIGMTEVDSSGNWSFGTRQPDQWDPLLTADAVDRRGNHSLISDTGQLTLIRRPLTHRPPRQQPRPLP